MSDQLIKHDFGIITAHRSEYAKEENDLRNNELRAQLRALKYATISITGKYIENLGSYKQTKVKEDSFLVIDQLDLGTLKADLMELGQIYNQDSIIFGHAGENGTLIGTSYRRTSYPGYGKAIKLTKPLF